MDEETDSESKSDLLLLSRRAQKSPTHCCSVLIQSLFSILSLRFPCVSNEEVNNCQRLSCSEQSDSKKPAGIRKPQCGGDRTTGRKIPAAVISSCVPWGTSLSQARQG